MQQPALRDLDQALRNWWSGSHRRPTWRKAGQSEGFVIRDLTVTRLNREWAEVTVPKAGRVKFRLTRAWADVTSASSARITCDRAGRWWVSITTGPPAFQRRQTGAVVGIDRGVANSVATSDGLMFHAPTLTAGEQARFVALQRRMSRQCKGSNRRNRTKGSLARPHACLGDRRRDFVEQTTTRLVRGYDLVVVEALNMSGMARRPKPKPDPDQPGAWLRNGARAKAALNRAISASCWGTLEQRLTHKTLASGTSVLVKVDPRDTSRTCADRGHTAADNRKSQAVFVCQSCGHSAHADTNAAINILARGVPDHTIPATVGVCGRTDRERTHQPGPASSVQPGTRTAA